MTRFFEHQARARRNTRVLLALMLLSVLVMGSTLYLAFHMFGLESMLAVSAELDDRAPADPLMTFAVFVLGTALVVAVASVGRVLALRGDGAQIAEMVGGRLISGQPRDGLDKRLLNVVEEMAIAAGLPVPQVFVLDDEPGINAFAAGKTPDEAAVAVTRGGLEKLTREELQGVIAHELSHILNGDSRLNLQLMGIVYGILCIGLFGRLLVRMGMPTPFGSRSRDRSGAAFLVVAGIVVFVLGLIGELCGKLIKAAVSRQREFLADASATQLTRNPRGLAAALAKIGGRGPGASIRAPAAEEASHFFFSDISVDALTPQWFATHPPLAARIVRLDPSFDGTLPEVGQGIAEPVVEGVAALAAASDHAHIPRAPADVVAGIGTRSISALDHATQALHAIPESLRQAAGHPYCACAAVFALLLSEQEAVRAQQLELIASMASPALAGETLRLAPAIAALPRRERIPLCALTSPALQTLTREQRAAFAKLVQRLSEADRSISIFEYVLTHTLQERLERRGGQRARSHKTLHAVRAELELLLSLIAHAGDLDGRRASTAFTAAASRLPELSLSLLGTGPKLLSALGPALHELRAVPPVLAERVVDACAHAAWSDQGVSENEWTLLQAVCGALGCPLPPSLDG